MHFRIFIPNITTSDPEHLSRAGLPLLRQGAIFLPATVEGERGMMVQWNGEPSVDMDGWRWVKSIEPGKYSVGFGPRPISPQELAHSRTFAGTAVRLGDGNEWTIPAAGQLPQTLRIGPDRTVSRTVRAEFKTYFDDSAKWFTDLMSPDRNLSISVQEFDVGVFEYLARALGLNYRITPEVINELTLFGTDNLFSCLRASIDGLAINEELLSQRLDQKKSEQPLDG